MPDIAFHISSETADTNGHCPSGDRTRITLPIDPAIQVPNDAQPVAWLHNLAFTNAIANVDTADGSNSLVLGTGDGAVKFNKGSAGNPWVGFRYKVTDATGTVHQMGIVAPLTKEHGMTSEVEWSGIPATMDGMALAEVYKTINDCFKVALGTTAYVSKSFQNKPNMTQPSAAILNDGTIKVLPCPLPGSSASGILVYTGVTASGNNVTVTATPNTKIGKATNSTALTNALTTHEFQLMTTAQINQTVSAVIRNGVAADAYSSAVSVFDALGGGPISTSDANAIWSDRNSFGGTEAVVTSGTTTFGLYPDSTANITLNIPIGSYELDGFERAIARQAKANATLWAAVTKAQAHGTVLADPDDDTQWEAAVSGKAVDGTVYTMIVRLIGDTEVNRCILQCALGVHVYSGGLLTIVLGFDSTQLGIGTEGPAQITATNAAKVDRTRAVVFHAPTLAAGSYSTEGKKGGSALAMIPVTAKVGDVQSWEAEVPVRVPSGIAGTSVTHLTVFLSNEDGESLNLLADRWSAQLILSY
jgi:hypothetical protein